MVGPDGVVLFCYKKRFNLSLKVLPSHPVWDFACLSLEIFMQLFSSHFCFLAIVVLLIFVLFLFAVINLSLLLFNVVFEVSYRCIDAIFNTRESSSSFFTRHILSKSSLGCKDLCIIISFLPFVEVFPSSISRMVSNILRGKLPRCLSPSWDEISAAELNFKKLSRLSKILKTKILSSLLIWWCPLSIFPSTCKFPFLLVFLFFLDLVVLFLPLIVFSGFHFPMLNSITMTNSISISWL